jgi:hypothetical protein
MQSRLASPRPGACGNLLASVPHGRHHRWLMIDLPQLLSALEQGDPHAATRLPPLVYDELLRLAAQRTARERPGQTLLATTLVHE